VEGAEVEVSEEGEGVSEVSDPEVTEEAFGEEEVLSNLINNKEAIK